jgi:hypothetical protein
VQAPPPRDAVPESSNGRANLSKRGLGKGGKQVQVGFVEVVVVVGSFIFGFLGTNIPLSTQFIRANILTCRLRLMIMSFS